MRRRRALRRRTHRRAKPTVSLAMIAGLAPAVGKEIEAYRTGGFGGVLQWASILTTGFDPADGQWKPGLAVRNFYGPLAIGYAAHTLASRLGINRALARAGIPLARI